MFSPILIMLWRRSPGAGKGPGGDVRDRAEGSGAAPAHDPRKSRRRPPTGFRRLPNPSALSRTSPRPPFLPLPLMTRAIAAGAAWRVRRRGWAGMGGVNL
jgi:hypothetical protein